MDQRPGDVTPQAVPARKTSAVRTILALLACGAAVAWAYNQAKVGMRPSTQWVKLIRSGDAEDRQVAARQLGESEPTDLQYAIPALIGAMADPDEPVRSASASGLGGAVLTAMRTKSAAAEVKDAARALTRALADEGAEVRIAAAGALGEFAVQAKGPEFPADPGEVASALARLLLDASPMARGRAESALARVAAVAPIAPPAALVEGLNAWPSTEARLAAAVALGSFKGEVGPTVAALTRALADKEAVVRSNAAAALAKLGVDASPAVPALVSALADPYVPVPPPATAPPLPGAQPLTDPAVQGALALGRIARAQADKGTPAAPEAIEALARSLHADRPALREASAQALRRAGKSASAIVPGLVGDLVAAVPAADDRNGPTVAALLGDVAPGTEKAGDAIAALTSALDAKAPATRMAAVVALGRFGKAAAAALPHLKELGEGAAGELAAAVKTASDRVEGKAPPDAPRRKGGGRAGLSPL